jgi:hypothetical protein
MNSLFDDSLQVVESVLGRHEGEGLSSRKQKQARIGVRGPSGVAHYLARLGARPNIQAEGLSCILNSRISPAA